jgi:4-diphosphocytidyl-2-C-methyl-D-erythritol kinase
VKRSPPRRVEVFGAAKVNVGWHVGEGRPDGYHDVCGLLQTISLCDRLEISVDDAEDGVRLRVPGFEALEDESNLVLHAARALERIDALPPLRPAATTIVVHKSIPVAAGLGGGSADAAAALVGLNTAWGARLTARELLEVAAEIGSDVPAIVLGGLVVASGRGERVRNLGSFTDGWLVLGISGEEVRAADAYAKFDELRATEGTALHHNDLEAAVCELVPDLVHRIDAMREAAGVAFVAGSGPTVVGVVADEAHARGAAARVRDRFTDVVVARPSSWGVRLQIGS